MFSQRGLLKKNKWIFESENKNPEEKMILQIGLLGGQEREKTLKLQENDLFGFFAKKQKPKNKTPQRKKGKKQEVTDTFCTLNNRPLFFYPT